MVYFEFVISDHFCITSERCSIFSFCLLSSAVYLHLHIGLLLLSSAFCILLLLHLLSSVFCLLSSVFYLLSSAYHLPSSAFCLLSDVPVCESNILILGKSNHSSKIQVGQGQISRSLCGRPARREDGLRRSIFSTSFYTVENFNHFGDIVHTSIDPVQQRWPPSISASVLLSVL